MPVVANRTAKERRHRLKVVDLTMLPSELPSGPVLYELNDGELIVTSAPGAARGAIDFKLSASLLFAAEQKGCGKAIVGDVGLVLWRNPDRVVTVDAAFFRKRHLPLRWGCEGYLESIPDLAVETRSDEDCSAYLQQKIADLHSAGVGVVLLIDPRQQCIIESRAGKPERKYTTGDKLCIPDICPELEVDVADLFDD